MCAYFSSVALNCTSNSVVFPVEFPGKNVLFLSIGSMFCENRTNFNLKIQMNLMVTMVTCDHGNRER